MLTTLTTNTPTRTPRARRNSLRALLAAVLAGLGAGCGGQTSFQPSTEPTPEPALIGAEPRAEPSTGPGVGQAPPAEQPRVATAATSGAPAPTRSSGVPSWSIQYEGTIVRRGKDYHIVDMYDVSSSDLAALKADGTRPIAYFSSQYEDWRLDAKQFRREDLGKPLDDWQGERWVNTKSAAVREIMLARLDLAKSRGFYGVDVDNVDIYEFDTGFDNSRSAAADYVNFLSREAHRRGLKFGLKNATDLIPSVAGSIDYYVNEQCHEYDEADVYAGVGKPVFNIEYRPLQRGTRGIYTIYKQGAVMDGRETVVAD